MDDLKSSGLFLSDLSMHDGSRFLAMQGTQRLSEIEFACDRVSKSSLLYSLMQAKHIVHVSTL